MPGASLVGWAWPGAFRLAKPIRASHFHLGISWCSRLEPLGVAPFELKNAPQRAVSLVVDARAQAIERLYRDRFAGYCDALAPVTGSREIMAGVARSWCGWTGRSVCWKAMMPT